MQEKTVQAKFEDKNFKYSLELKQDENVIILNEKQIESLINNYKKFKI
jgi:mannosyltransferase OCH1-like enzyme